MVQDSWLLAEWLDRLSVNSNVATALGSIPAFTDTVVSEGRQMRQCFWTSIKIPFKKNWRTKNWSNQSILLLILLLCILFFVLTYFFCRAATSRQRWRTRRNGRRTSTCSWRSAWWRTPRSGRQLSECSAIPSSSPGISPSDKRSTSWPRFAKNKKKSVFGILDILVRMRIRTSDKRMWIREAQKHMDPDADSALRYRTFTSFFKEKKSHK